MKSVEIFLFNYNFLGHLVVGFIFNFIGGKAEINDKNTLLQYSGRD